MKAHQLKKADKEVLLLVKKYIEENVSKDLAIATLARTYGINRNKLKAGFKVLFNDTVHQYIIQTRMVRAKELLLQTDKPIKEIASLVGCSQRNFYTEFKMYYKQTPASARIQNNEGDYSTLF